MSAGRVRLNLADMQAAARDGHAAQVAELVLPGAGPVAAAVADVGEWDLAGTAGWVQPEPKRLDRRLDHDGDWAWLHPVDWPYRTTPEDVLADAVDLAAERLPARLAVLVEHVAYGTGGKGLRISSHERSQVEAMIARCRVLVLRELAKEPRCRKPNIVKPQWRNRGPNSAVVTKTADGRFFVDGEEVEYLIAEDYAVAE